MGVQTLFVAFLIGFAAPSHGAELVGAIRLAGPALPPFAASTAATVQGGSAASYPRDLDVSKVPWIPKDLCTTERWGDDITVTFGNLTGGVVYVVTIFQAEIYFSSAGQRLFAIRVNGNLVAHEYDILRMNVPDQVVALRFATAADHAGQVRVSFERGSRDLPKACAVMLTRGEMPADPPQMPVPTISVLNPASAMPESYVDIVAEVHGAAGIADVDLLWLYNAAAFPCPFTGTRSGCVVEGAGTRYRWSIYVSAPGDRRFDVIVTDTFGNSWSAGERMIHVTEPSPPPPPPDTTPPTATITRPQHGATVSDTVIISATVTDNLGVAGVQFLLDGAPLGAEDLGAPYEIAWPTATAASGAHTLVAQARDAAGNMATTATITVYVSHEVPPAQSPFRLFRPSEMPPITNYAELDLQGEVLWLNLGSYSVPLCHSEPDSPTVWVQVPNSWGRAGGTFPVPIPDHCFASEGTDGLLSVETHDRLWSFFQFRRTGPQTATASAWAWCPTDGSADGFVNPYDQKSCGVRASGAAAGLGVVSRTASGDLGILICQLPNRLLGGPPYPPVVSPAIAADGNWQSTYYGSIPMGRRLAVRPGTPLPAGVRSELGIRIFQSLKRSCWIADRNDDGAITIQGDPLTISPAEARTLNEWWNGGELAEILPHLVLVID